jgi:hypothetical protein
VAALHVDGEQVVAENNECYEDVYWLHANLIRGGTK